MTDEETPDPAQEHADFIARYVQEAVSWAHDRFNEDPDFRHELVEVGNVLWRASNDTLDVRPPVRGEDGARVSPYLPEVLAEVWGSAGAQPPTFLGDVHTHLYDEELWAMHFPSHEDVQYHSALWDLWITNDAKIVPVSPLFQLVQTNLFGDVFTIERQPGRHTFATFEEQLDEMRRIGARYQAFQEDMDRRLNKIPDDIDHDRFIVTVQNELLAANVALAGRATLRFLPNPGYTPTDND